MQALLPEEPPQAFWIEHYYQVVATVATGPSTVRSVSGAFQSDTITGSSAAGSNVNLTGTTYDRGKVANSPPEPGHPPILIGVQALMHDFGFDQQEAVHVREADHGFVGCHSILSEIDVGSRVSYEGKIVSYSKEPREVTPENLSVSWET
jgi:hypothetical protein